MVIKMRRHFYLFVEICTLCVCVNILSVFGSSITADKQVTSTYGEDVTIIYFTHVDKNLNEVIKTIRCFADDQQIANSPDFFAPVSNNKFGNRLKVSSTPGEKYELHISNVKYSDANVFKIEVGFFDNKTKVLDTKNANTHLIVNGGPDMCGKTPPRTIEYKTKDSQIISLNVCGKPTPKVEWKLNGIPHNGEQEMIDSLEAKTKFTVNLNSIPLSEKCGMSLSYKVTGAIQARTLEKSILIKYPLLQPSKVDIASASSDGACVMVTWRQQGIGACSPFYEVSYQDIQSKGLKFENVTGVETKFCDDSLVARIAIVKVRAVPNQMYSTTSLSSSWNAFQVKNAGKNKQESKNNTVVIVVIIALIILIVIVVVFAGYMWKKKKAEGQSSEEEPMTRQLPADSNIYAAAPRLEQPRAGNNQSLYSELGAGGGFDGVHEPVEPSNYAEMKVDRFGVPVVGDTVEEEPRKKAGFIKTVDFLPEDKEDEKEGLKWKKKRAFPE